jgi:ParB-like chromosome segregation protein Spo0J
MAERYRLRQIDPQELKNHPLNAELYGSDVDPAFVDDIKKRGVLESCLATADGILVSGHRRRQAAILAGLKTIPVMIDYKLDARVDLEVREALIQSNRTTRERTVEQRTREFAELERIEKVRAEQRKANKQFRKQQNAAGNPVRLPVDAPADPPGRADEKAAQAVGLKRSTARKAKQVVEQIDRLQAEGSPETAEAARQALNAGHVAEAGRIAAGDVPGPAATETEDPAVVDRFGQPIPDGPPRAAFNFALGSAMANALGALRLAKGAIKGLGEGPGRELINIGAIQGDLDNARRTLRFGSPFCVCPYCQGKEKPCVGCGGKRWITEAVYDVLPPEKRPGDKSKAKPKKKSASA